MYVVVEISSGDFLQSRHCLMRIVEMKALKIAAAELCDALKMKQNVYHFTAFISSAGSYEVRPDTAQIHIRG